MPDESNPDNRLFGWSQLVLGPLLLAGGVLADRTLLIGVGVAALVVGVGQVVFRSRSNTVYYLASAIMAATLLWVMITG